MAPIAFQRGNRLFTAASALTILIGILHTTALANDPPNDTWADAFDAARAATLEAGPFSTSFYGTFVGVWIQVGALLVMLGSNNVMVVSMLRAEEAPIVLQRLAMFDCVCFAILAVFFAYLQIPPPMVSFALLTMLFSIAAAPKRRASSKFNGASSE